MGTKNLNSATDLITFTRASGGTALRKVGYGAELVANGDGSNTTGWQVINVALTTDGTEFTQTATASSSGGSYQTITTEAGKLYQLQAVMDQGSSASIRCRIDNGASVGTGGIFQQIGSGSVDTFFVAQSSQTTVYFRQGTTAVGQSSTFDNVSVKEIFYDRATDPLVLYNHPNNTPRIEYNADGTVKGLLIEEARTNLVTYSNDFSNSAWTRASMSVPPQNVTGPDGTTSGWTITANSTSSRIEETFTVATSSPYVYSIYAKAGTTDFLYLAPVLFTTPANSSGVWFDLTNGTVGTQQDTTVIGQIADAGNGWFRCSIYLTTTDSSDTSGVIRNTITKGNGQTTCDTNDTLLIYGAQMEAGSFPTSYIPTSGSTATRAADVATIPTSAFGYNSDAGSVAVEWTQPTWGGYVTMLSDNTAANRSIINQFTNGQVYFSTITNSVAQGDILSGTSVEGEYNKAATTIQFNNAAVSLNGAASIVDTTLAVPNVTNLSLGSYTVGGSTYLNGHIKSIKYYPRRLSNAQLQELTT